MAAQVNNDNRKTELQDIIAKLEQGVKDVFNSENYKNYLTVMSKFHRYSINNSLLIALQKPDATLVAGYKAWQEHKRQVKKGEKGIRILAPQTYTVRVERDVTKKDENGNFIFENGKPVTEKQLVEEKRIRFVPVSVFDVSQTYGEPLPSLKKVEELDGVVPEREAIFNALKNVSQIPIEFIPISGGTKGYYSPTEQKIYINTGMSDMQTIKTGIHEVAHKILHDPEKDALSAAESRNKKEVQAESVAYVVSNHFGLDTSDYSFGYIASWSNGKELNELKTSLNEIQKAAALIIDEVEKELSILREIPPLTHDDSSKASSNLEQAMNELQGFDKKPLLDKPVVTVLWSEHNAFKENEKYSLAVFDEKIKRYDRQVLELKKEAEAKGEYYPYFKTKFQIEFPMNGENHTYTGRQDIGDGDGGVIDHIKLVASHKLKDIEEFKPGDEKAKEEMKWVLETFVPYLENVKEIEMTEDKISQLKSSVDMLKAEKELAVKELSKDDNYKFFYAGSGGQDKEAIQFQKEKGWKRIWGSDSQGLNGDTWIVYRSVEDLPKWLQEYAAAQEKLGNIETVPSENTDKSSTKDNTGVNKLREFLINLQNDEYSGKQDYFIFKKDNGDYFFVTDACSQFNHVAIGTLTADGKGDGSGQLYSIMKNARHFMDNVEYDPVERLCNMVKDMEFMGVVRDERVLIDSKSVTSYNRVKPTCEWAYALEQYKQSLVKDKEIAQKGKRSTSKSSKGIADRMAAAKDKAKKQSKTTTKSKKERLEER